MKKSRTWFISIEGDKLIQPRSVEVGTTVNLPVDHAHPRAQHLRRSAVTQIVEVGWRSHSHVCESRAQVPGQTREGQRVPEGGQVVVVPRLIELL